MLAGHSRCADYALGFVLVSKTVEFCDLLQCQQYHVRIHPHQVVLAPLTEFLIGSGVYVLHLLRSVYKELHADHETGAADNKTG